MRHKCPDFEDYLFIVRQMLDSEASEEDEQRLMQHMASCAYCLHEYQLEQQIRAKLRCKLEKKPLPDGLKNLVRAQILRASINEN